MSSRLTIFVKCFRSQVLKKIYYSTGREKRNIFKTFKSFKVRVHMKNGTQFNNAVKKMSNTKNIRSLT